MSWRMTLLFAALATTAFHLAYASPLLSPLMLLFTFSLLQLARAPSARTSFYVALATGLACYAPHLAFFYGIFHFPALALWIIAAIWLPLFVILLRLALSRLPAHAAFLLAPILFTGLEYFRSELYPLRFSWLTPSLAFAPSATASTLGTYGLTFALFFFASLPFLFPRKHLLIGSLLLATLLALPQKKLLHRPAGPRFTAIQMEFPSDAELFTALNAALAQFPSTDLFMLPEYTLPTPPTPELLQWCAAHHTHLLIGGTAPVPNTDTFYNTAFVIGPDGTLLFSQAKSVPIQFFHDGLPAPSQSLWNSPWGPIGICICYDLSYTRITDELIRQGAKLLLVPTMDAASWGESEHLLHARIAPARAAEYHIPILRCASSGITQFTSPTGNLLASLPFTPSNSPTAITSAQIPLTSHPHLPLDRFFLLPCTLLTMISPLLLLKKRSAPPAPLAT